MPNKFGVPSLPNELGAPCYNLRIMETTGKFTVICPCCETTLSIDAQTGAVLSHEVKQKAHGSFDELRSEQEKQKQVRDQIFAQELGSQKDRERILEEKFREAMKRAGDDKDMPFKNPLDLD
ncbi:MAG TPA: hypothetical protein VGO50_18425 [Pyrinomonadaceae bacterium]|jgi:tRNA 2-selenouridine synthase SelU|nr:hypothetical protein [Pyrinomonadaceae bacterium]